MKLFKFQSQDLRRMLTTPHHWLIANEQGTGKTVLMSSFIRASKLPAVLVVCPATIKENWRKELLKWEVGATVLQGTSTLGYGRMTKGVYIINYDILTAWTEKLLTVNWDVIIADEVQYCANRSAKRTKAFIKICKSSKKARRFLLSGTPYTSKPDSFYNALNLVNPTDFHSIKEFEHNFCLFRYNGFSMVCKGVKNAEKLHELVSKRMIRHTKEEVLKDLPPKIISLIELPVDKDAYKKYLEVEQEIKTLKEDELKRLGWVGHYVDLKRAAYKAKEKSVLQWIDDFLDSGEKLVLFCVHLDIFDSIMKRYHKISVGVCGNTNNRDEIIEKFQTDPDIKLFVGQIRAAGTGITLTASSNVVFLEFADTATEHEQASDRCHRIGQTDCVNIYYLVAPGTVEKKIAKRLIQQNTDRQAILNGSVDEAALLGQSEDIAMEVFVDYYDRKDLHFL